MDKIISARIDEASANRISALARQLRTSKKAILERAIELFAAHIDTQEETDVFEKTSGAWIRKESPEQLVKAIRKAFRDSMLRNQ